MFSLEIFVTFIPLIIASVLYAALMFFPVTMTWISEENLEKTTAAGGLVFGFLFFNQMYALNLNHEISIIDIYIAFVLTISACVVLFALFTKRIKFGIVEIAGLLGLCASSYFLLA